MCEAFPRSTCPWCPARGLCARGRSPRAGTRVRRRRSGYSAIVEVPVPCRAASALFGRGALRTGPAAPGTGPGCLTGTARLCRLSPVRSSGPAALTQVSRSGGLVPGSILRNDRGRAGEKAQRLLSCPESVRPGRGALRRLLTVHVAHGRPNPARPWGPGLRPALPAPEDRDRGPTLPAPGDRDRGSPEKPHCAPEQTPRDVLGRKAPSLGLNVEFGDPRLLAP